MIRRRSTIEPVAGLWNGAAFPGDERRRARKAACRSRHTFSHMGRQCARIHIDGAGPFCLPTMASDWVTRARASQPTTDLSNLLMDPSAMNARTHTGFYRLTMLPKRSNHADATVIISTRGHRWKITRRHRL